MFFCDSHFHTLISPDSKAPLADMVAAAADAGMTDVCVTDHCDLLDWDGKPVTRFDWDAVRAQYFSARERLPKGLTLHLGLELGSTPVDPDAARRIVEEGGSELDFVLGSLHNWIGLEGGKDLYFSDFTGSPELCRRAVENTLEHTLSLVTHYPDCYDSLAHIIYPLRYIHRDGQSLTLDPYEEQVREIFRGIAQTGHALEVNTCRGTALDIWLPILRWFKECGGEFVTLGSDAHRPGDMARGIPEGALLLRQAGFRYVTIFSGRKPFPHPL